MEFQNPDLPLTEEQITQCEASCGLRFPHTLRELYLFANGGEPEPYVFENGEIDTVVSEFLPLVSERRGTAVQAYRSLVLEKALVPPELFPFAVDGGGDYFFTDTSSSRGAVYFFRSDSDASRGLRELNLSIAEFWHALKAE